MIRRLFFVGVFGLCIALYASAMRGFFLSDDMAVTFVLSGWQEKGMLWAQLFRKFFAGLDSQSHYYRPLPFLSYGLNLVAPTFDSFHWHLVNLAGHLLAGVAVFRITALLQRDAKPGWLPGLATALFLLCGTSAEAVAWISGRYDVFATALLLWAGALYLQSRASLDVFESGAWLCGILALTSKESAAVVPGLIGCLAWVKHGELPVLDRWRAIARDFVPWLVLIIGYFALRYALFGNMLQVYPGTHPLERLRAGTWLPSIDALWTWLMTALPNSAALSTALVLSIALLLVALGNFARNPAVRRPVIGMLGATIVSLVLLLPHLAGFPANGEGGRLLYTTSAFASILIAVSLRRLVPRGQTHAPASFVVAVIGMALIIAHAMLLNAALRTWRTAGAQMGELVESLARLPPSIKPDGYGIVIAPDAIGATPFARNANGALVLPPIQHDWLIRREIVYLPVDIPTLPELLKAQLIPKLKGLSLNETGDQLKENLAAQSDAATLWPSDMFCWSIGQSKLQRVDLPQPLDAAQWTSDVRAALRRAGCDYVPAP